jgi:hypothetical protein
MHTQVNEIDSDRHQCMSFFEFLEAICRAMAKASCGPNHLKFLKRSTREAAAAEKEPEEPATGMGSALARALTSKMGMGIPGLSAIPAPV